MPPRSGSQRTEGTRASPAGSADLIQSRGNGQRRGSEAVEAVTLDGVEMLSVVHQSGEGSPGERINRTQTPDGPPRLTGSVLTGTTSHQDSRPPHQPPGH